MEEVGEDVPPATGDGAFSPTRPPLDFYLIRDTSSLNPPKSQQLTVLDYWEQYHLGTSYTMFLCLDFVVFFF